MSKKMEDLAPLYPMSRQSRDGEHRWSELSVLTDCSRRILWVLYHRKLTVLPFPTHYQLLRNQCV